MASKKKPVRQRGKIKFSEYFKELSKGDKAAIKKEQSVQSNFHKREHGRTGEIVDKRGSSYVIKIKEFNKEDKMIKEMKALTLVEAQQLVKANDGSKEIEPYFGKFIKLKVKEVGELKKELEGLENHKIKPEDIIKIIDILPEDASDLNKIFSDISLDENEIKQIADIVAKYK